MASVRKVHPHFYGHTIKASIALGASLCRLLEIDVHFHWAVVATHNLCMYLGFRYLVLDAV